MKSTVAVVCLVSALSVAQDAPPVTVSVYYESMCAASQDWIVQQLLPTYNLLPDILVAEFYPYGYAETTANGDSYTFTCQHGPEECVGNIIQACALYYYPDNPHSVPFMGCNMADDPVDSAEQCANANGMDYAKISTCANGDLGIQLENKYGVITDALNQTPQGVPWILINGAHNDSDDITAQFDLLGLVCSAYKGTKPPACA